VTAPTPCSSTPSATPERSPVVAGAQLLGRPATGTLAPGAPADLVAYPADPLTCPTEQLLDLALTATVVGGELVHQ
jgi:predicted amidohydrolase YtcJ